MEKKPGHYKTSVGTIRHLFFGDIGDLQGYFAYETLYKKSMVFSNFLYSKDLLVAATKDYIETFQKPGQNP